MPLVRLLNLFPQFPLEHKPLCKSLQLLNAIAFENLDKQFLLLGRLPVLWMQIIILLHFFIALQYIFDGCVEYLLVLLLQRRITNQ